MIKQSRKAFNALNALAVRGHSKLAVGAGVLAAVASARAEGESTVPDSAAITSQLSTGIDSGMTVATKVVGVLVTLFVVGLVVKLIKKGRSAAA